MSLTYLGLLRFFLTVGGGLGGQILNFPLECSTTSWQGSFVVVEKFLSTSVLQCLSRRFLNELTLGAVITTSGRSFHKLVTLSENLSFLTFVQARSINNFKLSPIVPSLVSLSLCSLIMLDTSQFIYLNHITTSSSICKCRKFQSLKSFHIRNILHTRKLLCCASLYIFDGIYVFLFIRGP